MSFLNPSQIEITNVVYRSTNRFCSLAKPKFQKAIQYTENESEQSPDCSKCNQTLIVVDRYKTHHNA